MSKKDNKNLKKARKSLKKHKDHVMTFRVADIDYQFLQMLKNDGISISDYIRTTMRATPRYVEFLKIVNGLPKLSQPMVVDQHGLIVPAETTDTIVKRPDTASQEETPASKLGLPEGFGI